MVLTLKIGDRVIGEIKNRGDKVNPHNINPSHSYSFHKGRELNLSKIDGNWGGGGGGLKVFPREGGGG